MRALVLAVLRSQLCLQLHKCSGRCCCCWNQQATGSLGQELGTCPVHWQHGTVWLTRNSYSAPGFCLRSVLIPEDNQKGNTLLQTVSSGFQLWCEHLTLATKGCGPKPVSYRSRITDWWRKRRCFAGPLFSVFKNFLLQENHENKNLCISSGGELEAVHEWNMMWHTYIKMHIPNCPSDLI